MTSQPLRSGVDPNDIRADRFFLAAPRQDEMRIVRTGALEIIHHQIAAVGFDCRLEPLDGGEQIAKLVRFFRPGERDAATPEPVGNFQCDIAPFAHDLSSWNRTRTGTLRSEAEKTKYSTGSLSFSAGMALSSRRGRRGLDERPHLERHDHVHDADRE